MANWLEAAFGLPGEADAIAPKPRRQKPEVKSFWVVVAQPSGAPGDLGETAVCHYIVDDGILTLCDEHGKAGETHHVLAPGDDPRRIAGRLRRAAWRNERDAGERVPGFNRLVHYRTFDVV